jgi:hypothetical protein
MPITFRCACGKQSDMPESTLGKRVRCNFCGALSIVAVQESEEQERPEPDWETHIAESLLTGPDVTGGASASTGLLEAEPTVQAPSLFDEVPSGEVAAVATEAEVEPEPEFPRVENPKRYKVLTQRDRSFGGKFDPERLEQTLNDLAGQGWVVRSMAAGAIVGNREELVVLLEHG